MKIQMLITACLLVVLYRNYYSPGEAENFSNPTQPLEVRRRCPPGTQVFSTNNATEVTSHLLHDYANLSTFYPWQHMGSS